MAKRYNACYVILGPKPEKKFICFESGSNDNAQLAREIQKRHPKNDLVINYIRLASTAASETL